jgi:hypothetical protein
VSFRIDLHQDVAYTRCLNDGVVLATVQDALDALAFGGEAAPGRVLFRAANFPPAFYDLSTGLAGGIFQKFSNYAVKAAIVGDLETVPSERFREWMRECNRGGQVRFTADESAALAWLVA